MQPHYCATRTNRGQVMLLACLLFLAGSLALSAAAAGPALRRAGAAHAFRDARAGLSALSSVAEDVAYRKIKGLAVGDAESLAVGSTTASVTLVAVSGGVEVSAVASGGNFSRRGVLTLAEGEGASFHYGVQAGEGGIILENSSSVAGNVFSSGPIVGAGSNVLGGEAISAGSGGRIEGVHATSSAWAHTIVNADIDGDAHYQSISGTTVGGTLFSGSTDQATSSLAISDTQIEEWKADALAGGTHSSPCPYEIDDHTTLGPKKIGCNLKISGNPTITLAGPLWVSGTIEMENTATIKVDASLAGKSIAIVAHDPQSEEAGGLITLQNSVLFAGAGTGSYIMLVSQNRSVENGGSTAAITAKNSITGAVLLYAPHGEIALENSINAKEASAYRLRLKNTAKVTYETGIANLLFSAGPGGGYTIGGWKEVE